ncbi:MAG TPA: ABC transporter permease subunit [Deltaproteobacteria bacterium]|nr:ABC transporter permease subunit [Deltaproteobacteria bacterium]
MSELFLSGLKPENRARAYLVLVAVFLLLLLLKAVGGMPVWIDELPQHLDTSSIDQIGDAAKEKYTELVPLDLWLNTTFDFIRSDLGFDHVTRFVSKALKGLINIFDNILLGGRKGLGLGTPPWTVLLVVALVLGYALQGWRMSLLSGGTVCYFAVFGLWKYAMKTLALLSASVPISIAIGVLLGILAYKKKWLETALIPILNVAQTLPHFAYLIPVIVFFGVGHQTGVIATIIFAVPPMVRLTLLGLQKVPPEIVDAGKMGGCTTTQLLFRVQLPSARNEIMLGINQVIMQCLAMVVIAAFIGASGLGYRLLHKLQSLKIGQSFEIGIAIVLLAVVLDGLSRAWAAKKRDYTANLPFYHRHKYLILMIVLGTTATILSSYYPILAKIPRDLSISYAKNWDALVDFIVVNWYQDLEAFRTLILVDILTPLRDVFLYFPVIAVLFLIGGMGLILGGYYSALLTLGFLIFIGLAGWWDRAMITAYMVLFATFICIVVGVPLGIWAAMKEERANTALFWCDTFQTFPSFIYILPVIMLFQVNDLSAIMAVIVYAIIPAIRYTIEGLKSVPSELHEAVTMAGCNWWQRLIKLELPVSLPHIMLGVNQTVMFAFSMVIIAAFVGTIDLGQQIFKALSETNTGKGLVLGLCVSFMALAVDHLVTRWARERRALLGLS